MRITLAAMLALALAACAPGGSRPPWQARSGLWMTTYPADMGGLRTVICYAEGGPGDVYGDSRPTGEHEGLDCQPVQRQATTDGWKAEQACTLRGTPGVFRYEARRDGQVVASRTTIVDPGTRSPLVPPMELRVERVGGCPQGWSPGEVMRLTPADPDGRWRVVLPGQGGAQDRVRVLTALPPELASRR
jgi:hypothetical protein